mmetsp:Transcript_246/g.558  ORF Transcript_246/g.558 Transcript_246/m.558 type:complete len:323 (+) Transcript_246:94-1062(+)
MGQEHSKVKVHQGKQATGLPFLCVASDDLEEFGDFDRLWSDLCAALRTDWARDPNCQEGHVVEVSDSQFEVIKKFGGTALVFRYYLNKERGEIYEEVQQIPRIVISDTATTRLLRNPLRIEGWRQEVPPDFRRHGPLVAESVKLTLSRVLGREIEVFRDVPSKMRAHEPGIFSTMSEPLDEYTTFDELWDKIMKLLRTQEQNPFVKSASVSAEERRMDDLVEEFHVHYVQDGEKLKQADPGHSGEDVPMIMRCRGIKKMRVFSVVFLLSPMNRPIDVTHSAFTQDPLCVESWGQFVREPRCDDTTRAVVNECVLAMLERAAK